MEDPAKTGDGETMEETETFEEAPQEPEQAGAAEPAKEGRSTDPRQYDPEYMKDEYMPLVAELRKRVQDVLKPPLDTDIYLYKFLKARDFKIDVAEALFRSNMAYRERDRVDYIIDEYQPTEACAKYLTAGYHGVSKSGHLVWYDRVALLDPKGMVKAIRPEDYRKNFIRETENMRRIMERRIGETGKPCHQNVQVIDLYGLGMQHLYKPALDTFAASISDMEGNYPEGLYRLFIVRAPGVFPMAFNMVKGLLPPETQKKIVVLGKDYLSKLEEFIDISEIPDFLGGTCTRCKANNGVGCGTRPMDADMLGLYEGVRAGGTIPKELYGDADIERWDQVRVKSGKGESVKVVVEDPHTVITCEFTSKDTQMDVTVYYSPTDEPNPDLSNMTILKPTTKYNTSFMPAILEYHAENAGTYLLYYANINSWSEARLYYRVQVKPAVTSTMFARKKTVAEVSTLAMNEVGAVDTTEMEEPESAPVADLEMDRISQMTSQIAPGEEVVVKEGELYAKIKIPGTMGSKRKWVPRHHVLTEQGRLYTYLKDTDVDPTGVNKMRGIIVAEVGFADSKFAPVGMKGRMYVFELQDPNTGAVLQLSAESEQDGKEWVQALRRVAGTEGVQPQSARKRLLAVKGLRTFRSSENLSTGGYSDNVSVQRSPSLLRHRRGGDDTSSMMSSSSLSKPKSSPRSTPPAVMISPTEASPLKPAPSPEPRAEVKPVLAVTPTAPEPQFVIGQLTRKLNKQAQKLGMDDGKDLVIVALLLWIAVMLAF